MDALLLLVLLEGERKVETQFLYIINTQACSITFL